MHVAEYFDSLTLELEALKNRVRHLIGTKHLPTDGEWKETILRTILRRHLPSTVGVGRGFVVKPDKPSRQIDLLIYDTSKPLLYQDGDLVMITPDSVKGIIEVKTKVLNISKLNECAQKLADNAQFINDEISGESNDVNIFTGLFAYDSNLSDTDSYQILNTIKIASNNNKKRVISHLCLGKSLFVRFWSKSPCSEPDFNKWHSYSLNNKAVGFFVNNVVGFMAKDSVRVNQDVWFPTTGKENQKLDERTLID